MIIVSIDGVDAVVWFIPLVSVNVRLAQGTRPG